MAYADVPELLVSTSMTVIRAAIAAAVANLVILLLLTALQNPMDPTETWSGRGKQARWLVSALRSGGKIDDFRIPLDDARLRARS